MSRRQKSSSVEPHHPSDESDSVRKPKQRGALYSKAIRATYASLVGNVLLAVLKIAAGVLGRSRALLADGIHTATDIASSIAVLVGLRLASRRPDPEHPYGHGKAEVISGGLVAAVLVSTGAIVFWRGVAMSASTMSPESGTRTPTLLALVVAGVSIAAKELLARFKMLVAREVRSTALEADAWHHRSDALSSIVALAAIAASHFGGPGWRIVDPLGAAAVGIIIGFVGLQLLWKTGSELMDAMPPRDVIDRIRTEALAVSGVMEVEELRARKSGLEFLVDIHVEVDKDLSVEKGHDVARRVKEHLESADVQVRQALVHIEPYVPGDHPIPTR